MIDTLHAIIAAYGTYQVMILASKNLLLAMSVEAPWYVLQCYTSICRANELNRSIPVSRYMVAEPGRNQLILEYWPRRWPSSL